VNCSTAGNECSFALSTSTNLLLDQASKPSLSQATSQNGTDQATPSDASASGPAVSSSPLLLAWDQLELLHFWVAYTTHTMTDDPEQLEHYRTLMVREGLRFPFLMYSILGFAALHKAYRENDPTARRKHLHRATELQAAAMEDVKVYTHGASEDSCFALLIFSSILGMHHLADRSRLNSTSDAEFFHHFVTACRLAQGVRILVIDAWWPIINESAEMAPLIKVEQLERPYDIPEQVGRLHVLVNARSQLGDHEKTTYREAIDILEW
jgi:hypothetical protein